MKEKNTLVEMTHRKSSVIKAQIIGSEAALTSLEEALGHGDEQISKILEQFVRAVKEEALDEQEKLATKQQEQFEKDRMNEKHQHDQEIYEYKMKIHTQELELQKLHVQLNNVDEEKQSYKAELGNFQTTIL